MSNGGTVVPALFRHVDKGILTEHDVGYLDMVDSLHALDPVDAELWDRLQKGEFKVIPTPDDDWLEIRGMIENFEKTGRFYSKPERVWVPENEKKIIVASSRHWDEIISRVLRNPKEMFDFEPRQFEEFIANLLERDGLDVKLTPPSKDGGRDILAFTETSVGRHLYLVECKRYSPSNPVGVEVVRGLYGVLSQERATAAMIATTSRFTKGAIDFGNKLEYQMALRDFEAIVDWTNALASSDAIVE